ncbi:hypothetical protein KGF56_002830 [Candida oxycetoniae]|uniref:Uncharacterized protein n=1 Tax=Candida oxycetoniae TaxID=497107 RepID=A0AAI9SXC5_9ASCO|nr:uncharacterized protein KGF56_002830 [Candida oxycetoniae]KAI3404310.2 hypothetical protein KGF56_002830 [Candida oxycetoniae]
MKDIIEGMDSVQEQLAQLLLLVPPDVYRECEDYRFKIPTKAILEGRYFKLIESSDFKEISALPQLQTVLSQYPAKSLGEVLQEYVNLLVESSIKLTGEKYWFSLQCYAIAFLQLFVQVNFTGPPMSRIATEALWFPHVDEEQIQRDAVQALGFAGSQGYDLMQDPIHLIIAELILERLSDTPMELSIFSKSVVEKSEDILSCVGAFSQQSEMDMSKASLCWWRARAYQVHASVLSDPASIISSICSILLNNQVINKIATGQQSEIEKLLRIQFSLEQSRVHIQAQTEHRAIDPLVEALKISGLELLLSGAKAKRTKFQKFYTSGLIVLAKSSQKTVYDEDDDSNTNNSSIFEPETFQMYSDILLEKPEYEGLDDLNMEIENESKKIKIDYDMLKINLEENKLLPIAMTQKDIPINLKELDPNNQPALNNIDVLQLLLRLIVIKQTAPMNDPLVNEELSALVERILYAQPGHLNWLLYSRALWERSLLETGRSKTVERGILQMTSLVEEMGLKIKSRLIPQEEEAADSNQQASLRLRFIHQLPLLPQWSMDVKLAEKYMSLGVVKSALEIYERLGLHCEAALCYAATDREHEAEKILVNRIKSNPNDARAISILGDIKQDPALWEKAWEISRYSKAKASLSHYYYSPPAGSGRSKNLELAISNMFECLSSNPLSYENWFFYGCCGLESGQFELASEAFTRCVSLDDSNSYAWSNLASALIKLNRTKPAFNALKKAIRCGGDKKSWRIYENFMNVAVQLNEWNDVLFACRELLNIKKNEGNAAIDVPVLEKLSEILVSTEYPTESRLSHFQKSCIDLICNILPGMITSSARCWKIVARVELWRKKPWASLECHEKAYRAMVHNTELDSNEEIWNEVVEACVDLVSAFESLGELPGNFKEYANVKHMELLKCKVSKDSHQKTTRTIFSNMPRKNLAISAKLTILVSTVSSIPTKECVVKSANL